MKLRLIIFATLWLFGCGAGKYPVNDTSNSSDYGTLEGYQFAATFLTTELVGNIQSNICLEGTSSENCVKNKANLLNDYNFSLEQVTAKTDKIKAYTIRYNTPGGLNENRSVSGGVLLPNIAPDQIKGVVLYYHPTVFSKSAVPSCFNHNPKAEGYCMGRTTPDGDELAGIIAAQGYIVVIPDYVGLGFDDKVIHPYILYPELNALSGLYLLKATRSLLAELSYPLMPLDLCIVGFSEGGSYALAASRILQTSKNSFLADNSLTLKHTIAMSGAYDLLNSQLPMEIENIHIGDKYNIANEFTATSSKPALVSYLLSSYGFYELDQEYDSLLAPEFFNCLTCFISGQQYTIAQLFNTPILDETTIKNYITSAAATTGYGINGDNSVRALLTDSIIDDPRFKAMLAGASSLNWQTTTPVSLIYLSKDSLVTNQNSISAYNSLKNTSADGLVKAVVVNNTPETSHYFYHNQLSSQDEPIDHLQSNYILLIAALNEFN